MKEIIKYHNDMNIVPLTGFDEKEINVFFALCVKLRDKKEEEITLTFSELRNLVSYQSGHINRLYAVLKRVYTKMLSINFGYEDPDMIVGINLFSKFVVDKKSQTATIQTNHDLLYILNDLASNYTLFDLRDLVSLKSVYSKGAFRIFKQYRKTGWYEEELDILCVLLDAPKYNMSNFNTRVLAPIFKELPQFFPNLQVEKIRKGRKIYKLRFTWDVPEKVETEKIKEIEIDQIQQQINAIKIAIPVLDEANIKTLLAASDMSTILAKYYTLAMNKEIKNMTGFLLSAIKNNWTNESQAVKYIKSQSGQQEEMGELEKKLQRRMYEKIQARIDEEEKKYMD